jgi:hypothetical protein
VRDRKSKRGEKSNALKQAVEAERKVVLMIVISGVNYFVGHLLVFVGCCVLIERSGFRSCLLNISDLTLYISYMSPFFIYFFCNRQFRAYAQGKKGARRGA